MPVLGYLDDLIIVPLGILIAIRLIPAPLMSEFRNMATQRAQRPLSRSGLVAIVIIWLLAASLCIWLAWDLFRR